MQVETQSEIASFVHNANIPKEQFAGELASFSMETNRIPDPYYYTLDKDGDLYHPEGQTKVRNFIGRGNHVYELEYQAFTRIENWFRNTDGGSLIWVSPPSSGLYSTSKIIISEIEGKGEQKKLHNRAIVLDYDEDKCLKLAQNIAVFSHNHPLFQHIDQVRSMPIALNTRERSWLYILEEAIPEPALWGMVKEGLDKKVKIEAVQFAREIYQRLFRSPVEVQEGQEMLVGMIGEKRASCPLITKGASDVFLSSSSLIGGSIGERSLSGDRKSVV